MLAASESLTRKTVRGTVIQVSLNLGLKGLTILQTFIFARLFTPRDFGIFATANLSVSFVMLFSEMGLGQSLIRTKENPRLVADTALTMSLLVGCIFFGLIVALAPVAASVFGNPSLTDYVRFLSYLAFATAGILPAAFWDREMRFGISKVPPALSLVVGFAVTVVGIKVLHSGTWALFWGALAGFAASGAAVWLLAPYRPRPRFHLAQARAVYAFGWPLLISSFFGFVVWRYDDLMVRYFWGDEALGYYVVAFYLPMYLTDIVKMISSVLFPAFARLQDETRRLEYAFTMSNKYISIFIVPAGIGIFVFAPQIIHHIYTDKWAPAIPLLQVFALAFLARTITGYNWPLLAVSRGKTKIPMYANILGSLINVPPGWFIISRYGPMGAALLNLFLVLTGANIVKYIVIKGELGSIRFIRQAGKPLLAGLGAGAFAYLFQTVHAPGGAFSFGLGVGAYLLVYAGLLMALEGNALLVELRRLYRVAVGEVAA